MRSGVDSAFNVVDQAGRGCLCRPVAAEDVLLGVERAKVNTLVNVPGTQPFQGLQKIIGEGDRAN